MKLTVGSKELTTAFFVVNLQGNYSVILGRDLIHAMIVFLLLCTSS
jgi:hypothetical protein